MPSMTVKLMMPNIFKLKVVLLSVVAPLTFKSELRVIDLLTK